MKRRHFFAILLTAVLGLLLADTASAMYHPGLGRHMQRDPNGTATAPPARVGAGQPVNGRGFIQRDHNPHQQYADGMNLYQYVGSNPVNYVDPNGLERIIAVLNGQDVFRDGSDPDLEGMLIHSINNPPQPWTTDNDNIVGYFEEDADWSSPRAADWIIEEHEGTCHTIIVIGHSNGGDGARKVARQLNREELDVQLLFLFDPVGKPWHPGPDGTRSVSDNVETAINIRQTSDTRIGAGYGIRVGPIQVGPLMQGYQITPGQNITWNPPAGQFPDGPDGRGPDRGGQRYFAHTDIVYNRDNLRRLREAIENVPTEGNP